MRRNILTSLGATGAPLRRSLGLPNKRTTATATTTTTTAASAAASSAGTKTTTTTTTTAIPTHARVVVVGGGIIGTSLAYHLTRHAGFTDVLVLEQHQLTAGTTWHAAGLVVTFGSLSETSTELRKYTRDLYAHVLEAETGQATGFKPVGFIELATDADRLEEYRRIATFNRRCGVDVHEISAAEVQEKFPLCRTDDVLAGFYVAGDGRVNPVDAAMALAKGARSRGARIVEGAAARVVGVTTEPCAASPWERRVTGVRLAGGATVRAEYVVNCAGMWARQLGEACGVTVPNQAAEHYYLVTDAIPGVDPAWPVVEDPASHTYIRPEGAGLMVGLFEPAAAAWNVPRVPDGFSFGEIEPDWARMGPFVEKAMARVPATLSAGVKKFFCGPESFTPDLAPVVGEAPELKNYFVAAGMNSIGILTGGGIGRLLAHWIAHGQPDMDVTGINIDRLQPYQSTPAFRAARVVESLGNVYKVHFPHKARESARGAKRTPFYDRLAARGAYFRDVSGWECADWYGPPAGSGEARPEGGQRSWGRQPWFPLWAEEHRACREGVVLMDMSFMSKFAVTGRDAGRCLNRLCTADVAGVPVGTITYCQFLNDSGRVEADVTVSKLAEERYLVVATDTAHRHVEAWLRRHLPQQPPLPGTAGLQVSLHDVTGAQAQLNLQGPRARDLLRSVTSADLSSEAFPYRAVRDIDVGFARVTCARITYVGEMGYELHIPVEQALHVYERITDAAAAVAADGGASSDPPRLVHAGLKALASLRLEKGYRDFGHDVDNTDALDEVGLGFTADMGKEGGFVGRDALAARRAAAKAAGGLGSRLVSVRLLDPAPLMYHGEVLFRDGVCVGDVRAAAYGHTLGGAVGLAMVHAAGTGPGRGRTGAAAVDAAFLSNGRWEAEVAGRRLPCAVSLKPFYDPTNARIKV